jgi:hypothetical protein
MDANGPSLTPLTPASSGPTGPGRGAVASVISGTVIGVKKGDSAQTLEIQSPQGKIRFKADGDFQVGDKVRMTFPGNGGVVLERAGPEAEGTGDGPGAGYTLPRNLNAVKDLRAFEEQLVGWMGGKPQAGSAAAPDKDALARLTLPQLMMRALERKGGKDFLALALANLDPEVLTALLDSLEEAEGDPAAKAALADTLRAAGRSGEPAAASAARQTPAASGFLPAEAGSGHAPWFGRIAGRRDADGILFAAARMGNTGTGTGTGPVPGSPAPGAGASASAAPGGPVYRYTLDAGGNALEAFSSEAREPGEFADFELERNGGRLQVRFLDPAQSLTAGARTALAAAPAELRPGMLLASHYLQEFGEEPYYGKLTREFGTVLAQSGLLENPAPGQPAAIPKQEQMDNLLKLFVSYPRDGKDPAGQAKAWGQAVRDPEAFRKLLREMAPAEDMALLRPDTVLRVARGQAGPSEPAESGLAALLPGLAKELGSNPEAVAAVLRKLLPDSFDPAELLKLAKDAAPMGMGGKEHEALKFLLQSVASSLPQDASVPEGTPTQFFYYQGQEWRNLQVTWRREGGGRDGRGRPRKQAPLQVNVATQSKHMGQVSVDVSWEPKGAQLRFRNQRVDVRELLSRSLPELEKSLSLLDFKVSAWTYELLPDAQAPASPGGGFRGTGFLDLKG